MNIEENFERLYRQWCNETCFMSNPSDIFHDGSLQEIIKLGNEHQHEILTLIFNKMRKKMDHWFDALTLITGEDHLIETAREDRGNMKLMTDTWLQWAFDNGFCPLPPAKSIETAARATELEWLKFFYQNADFGPADSDVRDCIKEAFKKRTGKKMPLGYNHGRDGEEED